MWVEVKIRGAAPKKGANYFIHEFSAYLVARFPNLYFGSIQYSWGTWTYLATICIVFQFSEHLAKMQSCLAPWREPANNKIISIISKLNSFFPWIIPYCNNNNNNKPFTPPPPWGLSKGSLRFAPTESGRSFRRHLRLRTKKPARSATN